MGTAQKTFSRTSLKLFAAGVIAAAFASGAQANTFFDSPLAAPGVYAGTGNPNTDFTGTLLNGIELGLGVQYRKGAQVIPDASSSTYHVNTGFYSTPTDSCTGHCALWNIEFSINLRADGATNSTRLLSQGHATLDIQNVGNGVPLSLSVELLDNDLWGGTGTGTKNPTDSTTAWAAQNSENLAFFGLPLGFDPLANDTYLFTLTLFNSDDQIVSTADATVIAGTGATPLPAALPMFASGLGVFGYFARRKKKKSRAVGALA